MTRTAAILLSMVLHLQLLCMSSACILIIFLYVNTLCGMIHLVSVYAEIIDAFQLTDTL